jgi:hypothetical protein
MIVGIVGIVGGIRYLISNCRQPHGVHARFLGLLLPPCLIVFSLISHKILPFSLLCWKSLHVLHDATGSERCHYTPLSMVMHMKALI